MTVDELLSRISSRELTEWMTFFSMEPWGTEVEDWRAALVTSAVYNVNRDPKKHRKPFEPKDFMPNRQSIETQEQSGDEQRAIVEMWMRYLSGASTQSR